ncbi:hypothetical protein HG433_003695 [Candidatus Saccharibacteria bacterium]|nr:hypothetical protein [Candidatus Saccharibacteria bacterium]
MNADQSSAQPAEAPKPINGAQLVSLINALRKLPWPMTYEVYDRSRPRAGLAARQAT